MAIIANDITNHFFKWLNKLSSWMLLVAIIWLCWVLAQLLWLFLSPPVIPQLADLPKQTSTLQQPNYRNTLSFFANRPVTPNQIAKNISLKGVLTANPANNSSAMIAVDNQVKNYRVNQKLEGTDYTIVSVDWNEVVLQTSTGSQQVIKLHETMQLDQEFTLKPNKNNSVPNAPINGNTNKTPPAPNSNANQNSTTNTIEQAVEQLKTDPAGYLSKMGVMATGDSYQVTNTMPEHIRSRLGLKEGDQVLSINGQNVGGNPSQDADILTQIKDSGTATIRIKRNEKIITIRQQF